MSRTRRRRLPVLLLCLQSLLCLVQTVLTLDSGGGCKTTFVKVAGYAPSLPAPASPLYSSTYGHAVTAECYNKCKSLKDCGGFILDYAKATCYKIEASSTYYVTDYRQRQPQLLPDPGVSYFIKTCVPVGESCANRAWIAELTPGYELISAHHTVVPSVHSWSECSERCILSENCQSANYVEYSDTCSLSDSDSWEDPQALAPTLRTSTDYIDNECIADDEKYCWHDPIYNQSNIRADLSYDGGSLDECSRRCETNAYFKCRGYSFLSANSLSKSQCHLHSDLVLSPVGPLLKPTLTPHQGAVYYERIRCTNMSVTCNPKEMVVTLRSPKFKGQLYVEGHSETCSVLGSGQNTTSLVLRLDNNPCDVQYAYALSRTTNRTMLSAVVVVQYHRQIQLLGDAVVRVTCYLGSGETSTPSSNNNNLTIGTSVSVNTQAPQTEVTGIGNGSVTLPPAIGHLRAHMRIVDERTNKEVTSALQIGDPLQLQIYIDPPYNISYVRAGHLIAKSGSSNDETLLLLNWEGCPPDPKVFPGLREGSANQLVGDFKAFRFPSSPVLMLSVFLTFCPTGCRLVDCGNGVQSYGRKKREISIENDIEEIPLQVMLVVNERKEPPPPTSSHLEISSVLEHDTGEICISFVALSLMALLFLLIQGIILAVVCWYLGKREKETADTISLRRDFNEPTPMSHHVTWADQVDTSPGRQQGVTFTGI